MKLLATIGLLASLASGASAYAAASCADYPENGGAQGSISTAWGHSGHESPSDADRLNFARNACLAALEGVRQNCLAGNFTFDTKLVTVAETWNGWSDTKKDDWTGKRSWNGGSEVRCDFRYRKQALDF